MNDNLNKSMENNFLKNDEKHSETEAIAKITTSFGIILSLIVYGLTAYFTYS